MCDHQSQCGGSELVKVVFLLYFDSIRSCMKRILVVFMSPVGTNTYLCRLSLRSRFFRLKCRVRNREGPSPFGPVVNWWISSSQDETFYFYVRMEFPDRIPLYFRVRTSQNVCNHGLAVIHDTHPLIDKYLWYDKTFN